MDRIWDYECPEKDFQYCQITILTFKTCWFFGPFDNAHLSVCERSMKTCDSFKKNERRRKTTPRLGWIFSRSRWKMTQFIFWYMANCNVPHFGRRDRSHHVASSMLSVPKQRGCSGIRERKGVSSNTTRSQKLANLCSLWGSNVHWGRRGNTSILPWRRCHVRVIKILGFRNLILPQRYEPYQQRWKIWTYGIVKIHYIWINYNVVFTWNWPY